ncbi:MAG: hypothetical protein H6735_18440 [Alphaproteobacteria bacterium]|nr:hypothetical protein [Alphaproteobacteria bacterium]
MSGGANSPMFEQYKALKAANPDAILFFRVGDFYETFFEDAVVCARELEITLTSRNKNDAEPIPLAGVPHHNAAGYVQRLCDQGYRVAIADQVEDPSVAKGLVRREVVRVVTPGVTLDPTGLEGSRANWLVAVALADDGVGLAFLDASTGAFRGTTARDLPGALAEIARMSPREAVLGPGVALSLPGVTVSPLSAGAFEEGAAAAELGGILDAPRAGALCRAAGAALAYVRDRLGGRALNVHGFATWSSEAYLVVDETSSRNLEIQRTLIDGKRRGSLLALLDLCGTPMGSRRLADWLSFPLLDRPQLRRASSRWVRWSTTPACAATCARAWRRSRTSSGSRLASPRARRTPAISPPSAARWPRCRRWWCPCAATLTSACSAPRTWVRTSPPTSSTRWWTIHPSRPTTAG